MKRYFRYISLSVLFASLLLSFPVTVTWAETYSSEDDKYSPAFCNDIFDTNHNDMQWMDAVYFGGREIIFFTLVSSCSESYDSQLFFFTHQTGYSGSVNISNSSGLDFRFKLVEFNNVLYIFYTTSCTSCSGYNTSTVYYRTATVNHGPDGKDWKLEFSGQKSISAGVSSVKIRMAYLMEDSMYVIFSAGSTWYSISSADGLFNPGTPNSLVKMTLFTSSDSIKGAGGAVFQVPDPNVGTLDKLMIAYATGSTVKYFFFDGKAVYGQNAIGTALVPYVVPNTDSAHGVYPNSVRLIAGSASGYTDGTYSIQVFISSPIDSGTDQTWNHIFHREYIPAGENGNEGSWSSQWTHLGNDSKDDIHSVDAYVSDPSWAVIPLFKSASTNASDDIQMYLRIWYARGTHYSWPSSDHVTFRSSYYTSDILAHLSQVTTGPEKQDLSTETVLGVIEGTPPWPVNGGGGTDTGSNTSWVEYGKTNSYTVQTTWSVGGSVMVYKGIAFKERGDLKTKLTAGVKYTKTTSNNATANYAYTCKTYNDTPPGDLGWVVVLRPQILNDSYALYSYNRNPLFYEGDPSGDPMEASLITYGPDTDVQLLGYYLDKPSFAIGGDEIHASRELLGGMTARPLSNDLPGYVTGTTGWLGLTNYYSQMSESQSCPWNVTNLQTLLGDNSKTLTDLILTSSVGVSSSYYITYSTTEGHTWSNSASFSTAWDKAGFLFASGGEFNVNWNMDIATTSMLTAKLGFQYNIPDCGMWSHVIDAGKYYDCKLTHTAADTNEPGVGQDWTTYWEETPTPNAATTAWGTGTKYNGWCFATANVIPKLFVPKDNDTGYNCPWISNDIRNYEKPKPWCLTYYTYVPSMSTGATQSSRLTLKKANATLRLDRDNPENNQVSAKFSLEGVGPDFLDQTGKLVHLNVGSYVTDTGINLVVSRKVRGNSVVLQMKQADNPGSSIKVVLTYDQSRSLLNIALDADRVRMPGVVQSLAKAYTEGDSVAFPLGLFIGSEYYAQDTLDAHLTVNKQNIICELHAQR